MDQSQSDDLGAFLPYALNQAARVASVGFQRHYKDTYGMLRTEWRVLYHLGRYGELTAKEICERASEHKTKVSRAVAALELRRYLTREIRVEDRRHEGLSLTKEGARVFDELTKAARRYDAKLTASFSAEESEVLRRCLAKIAKLHP